MGGLRLFAWYTSDAQIIRRTLGNRVLVRYDQARAVEIIYPGGVERYNPFREWYDQYNRSNRAAGFIDRPVRRAIWGAKEWYDRNWIGSGTCEIYALPPEIGQLTALRSLALEGSARAGAVCRLEITIVSP